MGTSNQHFTVCACDLYFSRNKKYIKVKNFIFQTQKTACLDLFLSFDNNDFKTRNISEKKCDFWLSLLSTNQNRRRQNSAIWLADVSCVSVSECANCRFWGEVAILGGFFEPIPPIGPPQHIYIFGKEIISAITYQKISMRHQSAEKWRWF